MKKILVQFFKSGKFETMRRSIIIFGIIISILPGLVFIYQGYAENHSFYRQQGNYAWQLASLQLAEMNLGRQPHGGQEQYSLVTRDFGVVETELQLTPTVEVDEHLLYRLDPNERLRRDYSQNALVYNGTLTEDEKEYFRSVYFIFVSADNQSYHLTPQGEIVGYFSLLQPITRARQALLASHWTKFLLWLGLCVTIWFILIGISGKLLDELEMASRKLFEAERHGIINRIVCTYNHRINSPLMGIYGSLDLLNNVEQDPGKVRLIRSLGEAADKIKSATDEIAKLQDYRFVNYQGAEEMIALSEDKGKAGAA